MRVLAFAVVLLAESFLVILLPHYRFGVPNYERTAPFVFAVALLVFGGRQLAAETLQRFPIRYRFAIPNLLFLGLLIVLGRQLKVWVPDTGAPRISSVSLVLGEVFWIVFGVLSLLSLIAVLLPLGEAVRMARRLGLIWLYAALCTVISTLIRGYASAGWDMRPMRFEESLQHVTFSATWAVLRLLYPVVYSVPSARILGTPRFEILIKGICSGIEGMALIATLTVVWLIVTRRELRMERAILLVPLSLRVMWSMNLLRLVGLIAIGDAGYVRAAINGFHSVAGWISFNLVSAAFLLAAHRVRWFRKPEEEVADGPVAAYGWRNVPAIYLAPFLAIVAASMVSAATTGGFEWLYPLRFVVAVVVLWMFREEYRAIDWRFGWLGVVAGLAVALAWLLVRLGTAENPQTVDVTAVGLTALPVAERYGWIAIRVLAAVTTVPIAEELAFRGFVARRVMSSDVEAVPYARLSVLAIVLSSVLFGIMHGDMWWMGIVAGVVFAVVAKVRGRLGEAVAAHAVANLVLAVAAVRLHNYSLW